MFARCGRNWPGWPANCRCTTTGCCASPSGSTVSQPRRRPPNRHRQPSKRPRSHRRPSRFVSSRLNRRRSPPRRPKTSRPPRPPHPRNGTGSGSWSRTGWSGSAAPSYVPQALAAAGSATVFASLYAAHQLYGLLPSGLVFPLLALTAGATVAQSLRMGPYVAALGLVGAFVVPLLIESDEPHALPLFAYLAVITAVSLAVLRHRAWWWLAWLSLAGAMLWAPLWLGNAADPETPVVALYLLAQIGLFTAFRRGVPRVGFLAGIADTLMVRVVTRAAMWAVATGLFFLANADGFGTTSIAAAFVAAIGFLALAYRDDGSTT